jgi:putative ABC transport system permease protein
MIKHYFLISWRNIVRNKFYSLLLIAGFGVGLASSILLMMYTWDELTYDNFHEKKDRIFLVGVDQKEGETEEQSGWTTPPTGPAMQDFFPEVETFTRLCFWFDEVLVNKDDTQYIESNILGADSSIFDVFSITLLAGNPNTALTEPNTIVISETMARKYFGDKDPIGEVLRFEHFFSECRITGVAKDYPENSHFRFNMLLSMKSFKNIGFDFDESWGNHTFSTYVLLNGHANKQAVEAKFPQFIKTYFEPYLLREYGMTYEEVYEEKGNYYRMFLAPLEDVHLSTLIFSNREGKKILAYALGLIGLIILLLVCINFINLATTLSTKRVKEIGIRKAAGSSRASLASQFLVESCLIVLAGMGVGILLIQLFLSHFNELAQKSLSLNYEDIKVWATLFIVALLIGLLAGLYPAIILSSYRPAQALKDAASAPGKQWLRSSLVVFQFTLCIFMLVATAAVYNQLSFMSSKNLGFNKEHVLLIERPHALGSNGQTFKNELLANPQIRGLSFVNAMPGSSFDGHSQHLTGWPADYQPVIFPLLGDDDILNVLDIQITEGRGFKKEDKDRRLAILNESAIRKLKIENPLDQKIDQGTLGHEEVSIIGIAKDFHFQSFHHFIEPLVIYRVDWENLRRANYALVKINAEEYASTIAFIENKWNQLSGGKLFDYTFLDQELQQNMERETIMAKVYTIFSLIAIFIACLGLLGLASFYAEKRQKEIGIRKVNGARVLEVMALLNKDFMKWVGLAFLIASPLAWYSMNSWLQNFAYKTELSWWIFALAGIVALVISLLTVSIHSWQAATKNPVKALKYE